MHKDPESTKRHWWLDCLFTLLGSSRVKALSKHVGEIDPRSISEGCLFNFGIGKRDLAWNWMVLSVQLMESRKILLISGNVIAIAFHIKCRSFSEWMKVIQDWE